MKVTKRDAAIATIAYADIFEYALTTDELARWLVFYKQPHRPVQITLPKEFLHIGSSICFPKRRSLVGFRKKRHEWSDAKWRIVYQVAPWYRFIPTIGLIGITGALAMDNATRDDDIDLFFIVDPHSLWVSRFFITLVTELIGRRRHQGEKHAADKICLNMFMSSALLTLPKSERDLFAAHEVLQMVPVWSRGDIYEQFLKANAWVREFLPNAWEEKQKVFSDKEKAKRDRAKDSIFLYYFSLITSSLLQFFEIPVKILQLWYMRNRRTTEVINDTVLRFHPRDARDWIKKKLRSRLARFNIPLDNIFYRR